MSQMYYIFSVKWTKDAGEVATWWRADNNGYCFRMDWAGKYSQEQIDAHPEYYNNGFSTVAIPCEVVDERVIQVVEVGGFLNEYANKAREEQAARDQQANSRQHPGWPGVSVS
jgi:hypothetical protein